MTDQLPQKTGEKRPNNHEHYEEENGGTPKKQKVDLEDGPRRMVTIQYVYCLVWSKKQQNPVNKLLLGRQLCAFQLLAISQARGLLLPPPSPKKFTSTKLWELNAFLKNMDALLFSRCQSAGHLLPYFRTDTPMQVFERILRKVFYTTCPSPISYRQLKLLSFWMFRRRRFSHVLVVTSKRNHVQGCSFSSMTELTQNPDDLMWNALMNNLACARFKVLKA